MKSREEIMNMLEAFDLTGSLRDAGDLTGVSHHTVACCVAMRDAGALAGDGPRRRERIIDPCLNSNAHHLMGRPGRRAHAAE